MHPKLSLWTEGLRQGKVMFYREMSSSMVPFIRQGDLVKVIPPPCRRPQLGEIVLWQRGESLVLHRVVARFDNRIITKGDALASWDAPISPEDILGKAISRQRRGKERTLVSLPARTLGLSFNLLSACVLRLLRVLSAIKRSGEKLSLNIR